MLKLGRLMLLLALAVMLAGIGACSGYVAVGVRDSDYWCDCPDACEDFGCAEKAGIKEPGLPGML